MSGSIEGYSLSIMADRDSASSLTDMGTSYTRMVEANLSETPERTPFLSETALKETTQILLESPTSLPLPTPTADSFPNMESMTTSIGKSYLELLAENAPSVPSPTSETPINPYQHILDQVPGVIPSPTPDNTLTIRDLPFSGIQLHIHEDSRGINEAGLKKYGDDKQFMVLFPKPLTSYEIAMADLYADSLGLKKIKK
jgi:hypothetical protein